MQLLQLKAVHFDVYRPHHQILGPEMSHLKATVLGDNSPLPAEMSEAGSRIAGGAAAFAVL